jgi:phosphoribosylglycinamide formyltransferase 1
LSNAPINLAVLISGSGTTLQNLIDKIDWGLLKAKIGVVVASKPGIAGIERAAKANVPCHTIERSSFADVVAFSEAAFAHCEKAGAELVCLAGWLPLVKIPPAFVGKVMNIHPALLPSFGGRGMYGHRVHEAVLAHGCKISGCTVHFVDDTYDSGPIILQRAVRVREDDTPETLAARVFEQEQIAYPIAIELFRLGRLRIEGRRVVRLPTVT